ncbi:hypothetical protein EON64_00230 [archaeon]|nr:MAG: hypothetical protein EON64_00230 [archaeon]
MLETNAAHENRHINEQLMFCLQLWCYPPHPTLSEQLYHEYNYFSYDSFVFMLSGVNCVALDNLDMFLPAACKDKLAYNIIKALGLGLQDAFPQVRLAATKACYHLVAYLKDKEVLRKLKSQEQAVDREDWRSFNLIKDCNPAMAEYVEHSSKKDQLTLSALLAAHLSSIIMPRVLLNVFYPAESIQNVSQVIKNELMGARDGRPLYSYPSLFHSAQYYVHCTKHGNHNIVEAACYALCQLYVTHSAEIISRGDVDGALEGGLGVFYASLTDQRWPVGDSAILTSAQLLYRYASYLPAPVFSCPILPKRSTLTGVVERSPWPQLFLTSYLGYLRHGIPTVRSHALQALTLLLRHADWEEEIGIALDQYVNTYLLQALQSTTAKIISSFLPPTMLEKYRTPGSGEVIRSDVRMEARVGLDKDIGQVKEVKGTRSWDCCIDCQDLRSVSPAEVTGGVLDLCKELCSKWGMHVYTKKRDLVIENDEIYRKLSSQFSSPSGPQYGKLHMCILQALLLLVGDGLEGVARITINETQEIVYKQVC